MRAQFVVSLVIAMGIAFGLSSATDNVQARVDDSHSSTGLSTFISPLNPTSSRASSPAGVSYEAIQYTGYNPPDPSIAVGPSDIAVVTNNIIRFYDKTSPGSILHEDTLNNWYSAAVPAGTLIFDPKIIYDQWNGHYILVALGLKNSTNQSWWLVSASSDSNTNGTWYKYAFDATLNNGTPTMHWADYPGIGVDGVALYLTANMYDFGLGGYQGGKIRIINLADVEAGRNVTWFDFSGLQNADGSLASTIQPAQRYDLIGPPMYLVNASSSGNSLTYWRVDNPLNQTPTLTKINIPVDPFSTAPNAEQPNTTIRINTGDSTRLYQAQYRFGGIWTAHVISYNTVNGPRAAVRLYEIKASGSGLFNEFTIWSPDFYFFYPSLATDNDDDLVVSCSLSGNTSFPSIVYFGRLASDPPNTYYATISTLKASSINFQNGNPAFWGDYSGTAIDPNGYTVWIFNEFAKTSSSWSTWIGAVAYKFRVFLPVILNNY
jgi:hypothetical protein